MAGPPPEGGVPPPLPGHRVRPEREQPTPDSGRSEGNRGEVGPVGPGPEGPGPPLGVPAAVMRIVSPRVTNGPATCRIPRVFP